MTSPLQCWLQTVFQERGTGTNSRPRPRKVIPAGSRHRRLPMNRHFIPLLTLLLLLVLNMPAAGAPPISPLGDKIGQDRHGATIYQVPANGIKIGYKLVGSGEPLVMIAGLANTMDVWPTEVIE